jgi:hypothetical protein
VNPHRHNATLQALSLESNQIGDIGAAAICEGLRCVKYYCVFSSILSAFFALVYVGKEGEHLTDVPVHPTMGSV